MLLFFATEVCLLACVFFAVLLWGRSDLQQCRAVAPATMLPCDTLTDAKISNICSNIVRRRTDSVVMQRVRSAQANVFPFSRLNQCSVKCIAPQLLCVSQVKTGRLTALPRINQLDAAGELTPISLFPFVVFTLLLFVFSAGTFSQKLNGGRHSRFIAMCSEAKDQINMVLLLLLLLLLPLMWVHRMH